MKNEKKYNKELLRLEALVGFTTVVTFLAMIVTVAYAEMQDYIKIVLFIIFFAFFFAIMFALLKMEQIVGYYECQKCHHKYVPTYKAVFLAMHCGRTRYMTCPKCHKKSWQRKVLSK